jgi:ATP-binding protein involved in chromosome partitioning
MSTVMDPDLNVDVVKAGMVKDLKISGSDVALTVELTTPACPMKEKIKSDAESALKMLSGVGAVKVTMTSKVRPAPMGTSKDALLPGVKDADFYGPSIPTMTGIHRKPVSVDGKTLEALEAHGLKIMSIGFMVEPDQALIWRGPMIHGALMQLVRDVNWGELDYLVLDLPPGTGDVPLTIAQQVRSSGAVLVTTPQDVALADVVRAKHMFDKLSIPVLGIVENMTEFICPHCGKGTHIFDEGGGKKAAEMMAVTFLGEIPLDLKIRQGGDRGLPIVVGNPESAQAISFMALAQRIAARVSQENAQRHNLSVTIKAPTV